MIKPTPPQNVANSPIDQFDSFLALMTLLGLDNALLGEFSTVRDVLEDSLLLL